MTFEKALIHSYTYEILEMYFVTRMSADFMYTLSNKYYEESKYSNRFYNRTKQLNDFVNEVWAFHFDEESTYEDSGYLKLEFIFLNEIYSSLKTKNPVPLEYISDEVRNSNFFNILLEEQLVFIEKDMLILNDSFVDLMTKIKTKYVESI